MNRTKQGAGKLGLVFLSALVAALTGCTTYEPQPRAGGMEYEPADQADGPYAGIRTESDFYEPLGLYGRWEVVGSNGRCWIPGRVGAEWSPYSDGYWRRTDAGWYWVSEEPWGWATYHYGRWDSSPQFGWYWVPQTHWAPAWVSWRQGGGYVGWAPLGPSGRAVVVVRGATPRGYVFVEERRFLDPVRSARITVNNTVINRTVINEGPVTASIEHASGRTLQAVPVRQLRNREEAQIVARRPAPTATREKSVQPPVRHQAGTVLPARESRPVAKSVGSTDHSQPPAVKKEAQNSAERNRMAKVDAAKRAPPQNARVAERKKSQPVSSAIIAKPVVKPATGQRNKPEVKRETQKPVAKVKTKPVPDRPAATRESPEQKTGKDDEKKDGGPR